MAPAHAAMGMPNVQGYTIPRRYPEGCFLGQVWQNRILCMATHITTHRLHWGYIHLGLRRDSHALVLSWVVFARTQGLAYAISPRVQVPPERVLALNYHVDISKPSMQCTYIYVCIHTHAHLHICFSKSTRIRVCRCIYTRNYIDVIVYIYMYMYVYARILVFWALKVGTVGVRGCRGGEQRLEFQQPWAQHVGSKGLRRVWSRVGLTVGRGLEWLQG